MKKVLLFCTMIVSLVLSLAAEQCQGITQKGARCRRNASAGSQYCWQHGGKANESTKTVDRPSRITKPRSLALPRAGFYDGNGEGTGWRVEDMPTCKAKNEDGSSCTKKCYGGTGYCCNHSHLAEESPLERTKKKMGELERWIKKRNGYRPRNLKEVRIMSPAAPSQFDGWGVEFQYETDGVDYVLSSSGPDMKFGTSDDITILHKEGKSRWVDWKLNCLQNEK